ncbi:hypothetical protein GCM10023238_31610 [Streptomyces heliomycini]
MDTLVGALVGFAAAMVDTNSQGGKPCRGALTTVGRAREGAARLLADPQAAPAAWTPPAAAWPPTLVDLRATADAASGECGMRALPQERVVLVEQAGHRTLAATVRRLGLLPDPARARTRRTRGHDGDRRTRGGRRRAPRRPAGRRPDARGTTPSPPSSGSGGPSIPASTPAP